VAASQKHHLQGDALLSRDRGFYRYYFVDLRVIGPADRR
jgi:hypothetical protein